MGTFTILDILNTNNLPDTLIISSNNNIKLLRKKVIEQGYIIDSEIFLIDKGKPYIIIKFIKGNKKYSKKDIILGPILKNNPNYKKYLINKNKKILNSISNRKFLLNLKYRFIIFVLKYL